MREKRLNRVLDVITRKNLHACILKGMDNIFYLTGFRGSEGTLLVTRGDVVLLTDSRYITCAQETAKGCTIVETRGGEQAVDEVLKRYGVARTVFE
jgi:Xaa-Pro aminopeptidase